MTGFYAPFHIKHPWDVPTTVMDFVGNSARFTGPVHVADNAIISGDVRVSGRLLGNAQGTYYPAMQVAFVTVNCQTNTAAAELNLPTDAHIHDITYMLIDNHFGTAAADVNIVIGTSGDDDQYATIAASGGAPSIMSIFGPGAAAVTANQHQFTGVSGAALHGKAAGGIFIKTTAVSGTVSSKNALLSFLFTRSV